MCGARIQAVMTRGMDGGLMRLRIHSSSGNVWVENEAK